MKAWLYGICLIGFSVPAALRAAEQPWLDKSAPVEVRAKALVAALTLDEKMQLVVGYFSGEAPGKGDPRPFGGLAGSAGYVPGVMRVGIPPLFETDAGLGVATTSGAKIRGRTALPSGLALASAFNAPLALAAGQMIGNEARFSGFNVQLAGGVNLLRDPRNGRNFEYAGEDPLLAGTVVGNAIKGIQSNSILSTIKHFAFNDQETARGRVSVEIGEAAARMSDLLAFQLAIEIGDPASVMCAYNRYRGVYACESPELLNGYLKHDWGYKGFVMSDWGGVHSTIPAALAGLDQQSGSPFDRSTYFAGALKEAVVDGHVPLARLDDMITRIVRQMLAKGLYDLPVNGDRTSQIDFTAHAKLTGDIAAEGIVLLKNENALPLKKDMPKVAMIGGHADIGVISGGGSSQVYPREGRIDFNAPPKAWPGVPIYYPSSPQKELAARLSGKVAYASGEDRAAAVKLAKQSDVALVFATQWMAEASDAPNLELESDQNALISEVAEANPNTVVVLETGNPVTMPWLPKVAAVVEAWYPGTSGGVAIAQILTGEINPSGHLPVTFPVNEGQLPRSVIPKDPGGDAKPTVNYDVEGAAVGYKWFDKRKRKPLFAFGHGLSYTKFVYSDLRVDGAKGHLRAVVTVQNAGAVAGKAVVQIYAAPGAAATWESPRRLVGFAKIDLKPGAKAKSEIWLDKRLLSMYDPAHKQWKFKPGEYRFTAGGSSTDEAVVLKRRLPANIF